VPSEEEETFRRLAVELRILEGTGEALQSRIGMVNAALTELTVASATLEGLEKEKENAPLFVPIGGGSYVKAKLGTSDTVIVGVGAGVTVEKTIKEAKENLETRMAELGKTRTTLQQQLVQVVERIRDDRSKLDEVTAKLSQRERTQSV